MTRLETPAELRRYRGHAIAKNEMGRWVYADGTLVSVDPDRACGHCGKPNTPEGHDACLGTIPGAINACCGHGSPGEAYVQFEVDPATTPENARSSAIEYLRLHTNLPPVGVRAALALFDAGVLAGRLQAMMCGEEE